MDSFTVLSCHSVNYAGRSTMTAGSQSSRDDAALEHEHVNLRRASIAYQRPSLTLSLWQIATSAVPLLVILFAMYRLLPWSIWVTMALAFPAAGCVVRLFIIQHDCGHGSFFRSRWSNDVVGTLCSLATLTPYAMWRRQHAGHHSHWNNLDRRHAGSDIYSSCATLAEYRKMSRWRQRVYRLAQHPLIALVALPPIVFLLLYRVPFDTPKSWQAERRSVYLTNAALLAVFVGLAAFVGVREVLIVQVPIIVLSASVGVWLFSIQHRFETALWARQPAWDPVAASLGGSSYLKLPAVLQWFTGNIGFHHVHHLNPRIPNYRLQACHVATPALAAVRPLPVRRVLASWRLALWDEELDRLVPFPEAVETK
jgi:omega-6 fatty acid desaturase (delta-12 desaturase)